MRDDRLCLEHVETSGAYRIPWRPAFSPFRFPDLPGPNKTSDKDSRMLIVTSRPFRIGGLLPFGQQEHRYPDTVWRRAGTGRDTARKG
jgi:hypothetical protein